MEVFSSSTRVALFVLLTVLGNWIVGVENPPVRVVLAIAAFVVFLIVQHHRRIYIVLKTLPRDFRFYLNYRLTIQQVKQFERSNATIAKLLVDRTRRTPDKPCFLFEDQTWTFRDVDDYSNRVARILQSRGVRKGSVVALVMGNRPEFACIWLGVSKLGAVTALINYNLRNQPLAHCITAAKSMITIFSDQFASGILEVREKLGGMELMQLGGNPSDGVIDIGQLMTSESTNPPVVKDILGYRDIVLYVYTSGTTGLPKPALVPQSKLLLCPLVLVSMIGMRSTDVLYACMPMYHALAGVFAVLAPIVSDIRTVIARRFSASKFWQDCVDYNITCTQYIGEMCRILLATPESPLDRQHKLRLMTGVGIRPADWVQMQERFGIRHIVEVYGASESNACLMNNIENKVGAAGFLPRCVPLSYYPMAIVRVDPETSEPIRDPATSFCVRCEDGEPGLMIGLCGDDNPTREFVGYVDREATEKKILRDVFVKGDKYFNTGDLLVMDEYGYVYFKDRTGDTYRWKGENVSTVEVETMVLNVLRDCKGVAVYGVTVPGYSGRAGMLAVLDPERVCDLAKLADELPRLLPTYARPLFVRLMDAMPMTSTFKVSKVQLQREGYDPEHVKDPLFMYDPRVKAFVPITSPLLNDVRENRIRI